MSASGATRRTRLLRALAAGAVLAWGALQVHLAIADVWDEARFVHRPLSEHWTLGHAMGVALSARTGMFRPLPMVALALLDVGTGDAGLAWRLARAGNAALLVAAWGALLALVRKWSQSSPGLDLALVLFLVLAGSSTIVAAWTPNLFDAWSLAALAFGLLALASGRASLAGVLFVAAIFSKEIAALVFPLLAGLVLLGRVERRPALRAGLVALAGGAAYAALRSWLWAADRAEVIRGYPPLQLVKTAGVWAESFWIQTVRHDGVRLWGFVPFALAVALLRTWRARGVFLGLAGCGAVLYWGSLPGYTPDLVHYLHFAGRLFLVPYWIALLLLALEGRRKLLPLLLVPVALGGWATARDHARFERLYADVYRRAAASPAGLRIDDPSGDDREEQPWRNLAIGDFPDSPWELDARDGALRFRGGPRAARAPGG